MNQATATVAILAGALVGGGLFLLVGFFMGVDMLPDRPGSSGSLRDSLKGLSGRLIACLVVGLGRHGRQPGAGVIQPNEDLGNYQDRGLL